MEAGQPSYVGRFKKVTHFEAVFFPLIGMATSGAALIAWYLLVTNRK